MKTSNEKPREQMTYVAPKTKLIEVKIEGVLCNSDNSITDVPENEYGEY